MTRYRLIVETDAAAFRDVDEIVATVEVALDAQRQHGETATVWFDGEIIAPNFDLTTEPVPIDPEYLRQRHIEEEPHDFDFGRDVPWTASRDDQPPYRTGRGIG